MHRRPTTPARVGSLTIGGGAEIRVQSMTTTSTMDTEACVAQARRIIDAGGELVRLTTQGEREARNMAAIREALHSQGYCQPLVADVHFNARVADVAAACCDKVRINPGNYVDPARTFRRVEYADAEYQAELGRIEARLLPLLRICREHKTALRIGVNHGSLSDRIMSRYGDTPAGIVESCMEFLRICRREEFLDVVVSIKASDVKVMVESVRLLVRAMDREDMHFPLHLGVTEAGEGEDGRIRSAVGIGALLTEGIGDTIRVSLSEEPEREIPVAQTIVSLIADCAERRESVKAVDGTLTLAFDDDDTERLALRAAMSAAAALIDGEARNLTITNHGIEQRELADSILQAAGVRRTRPEFISCPGCGRTLYALPETIARVKAAVNAAAESDPRLRQLKIAVMGCIVNGPGEMAGADYGYVGAGPGRISLYEGKTCVEKNIPQEEAVERLLNLIKSH